MQEVDDYANDTSTSAPLRLTGGGDISTESQEDVPTISPQHTLENEDMSQVLNENENDLTSLVDQENSMSEQDIRDILFEAGYTPDVINDAIANKIKAGVDSSNSMLFAESDESGSKFAEGNAFDILKEIRVKNINKIVIGTLNINSLAPKFDQLSEIIGQHLDILTVQETKLDPSFPPQQ